ncbi:MAG: hypothetical protein ACRD3J_16090 [Thermoanaerobaculia bacterium]
MKHALPVRTIIFGALFACSATLHAQGATCNQPDSVSTHLIAYINAVMGDSALRNGLGLPVATPSEITLISDSTVCAHAGAAIDSVALDSDPTQTLLPPSGAPLYVFRIGSAFGVFDGTVHNDHFAFILFFGSVWQFLSMGAI